jgi:hypothetical protein
MNGVPAQDWEAELIRAAVARLRAGILALVLGLAGATALAVATIWLLLRGGPNVGQHLRLLANYFPGYSVTWPGALIGAAYGALSGASIGYALGWIYTWVAVIRARRAQARRSGSRDPRTHA